MSLFHPSARSTILIFALILSSFNHFCRADEAPVLRAILFRVTGPELSAPSYLFATIHSNDPRVVELQGPARNVFANSAGVAVEVVPDASAIVNSMVTMTYNDGRLLRDLVSDSLYRETIAAFAERDIPEAAFQDFKPWAAMLLLSTPAGENSDFLDVMLYQRALELGKPVRGLETMDEQLALFDEMSESDQVALLRQTVNTRSRLPEMFEALLAAYLGRDLERLMMLSECYLSSGNDPALAARFEAQMISARNRRMVERMQPLLRQGNWFIAVGALHLPRSDGIVAQLRHLGYRVTPVF